MSQDALNNSSRLEGYLKELKKRLSAQDGLEESLDQLRVFKNDKLREIRKEDGSCEIPLLSLLRRQTDLAEAVLIGAAEITHAELTSRGMRPEGPFAITAMGKFGGREITYGSDLDIIYIYKNLADQEYYTRLGQRIITALTLPTMHGIAYKIDTALRPSGNAGTLVARLASFEEYHKKEARTWERQALIRARQVFGDKSFRDEITRKIEAIVYQRPPKSMAEDIIHLRGRMENELCKEDANCFNLKFGRGGIIDIEFTVQYLQLKHGFEKESIRIGNTYEALAAIADEKLLDRSLAQDLRDAYLLNRTVETRMRFYMEQPTDTLRRDSDLFNSVQERFDEPLWEKLSFMREKVRSIYLRVLK